MDAPKDYQESDRIVGSSPLLGQVRDHIRRLHYSIRTETAYLGWIKRYILFHGKRHPQEMGEREIEAFLNHLAVHGQVAARAPKTKPSMPWCSATARYSAANWPRT